MRIALFLIAVLGLVGPLWAQSPLDGTWKVNPDSAQFPEKPQIVVLQSGTFQCPTCDPKINVKADGTDQPVQGSPTIDTMAVKIVDDKTVETTSKKGGKVVERAKSILSTDGKTSTTEFTSYPEASKQPVTGKETMIRTAPGPSGSHALSGSWRVQRLAVSDNSLTFTYKSSPNGLTMTDPLGESYDAKFDGKDYSIKGASGYSVSLAKVNDHSIDEIVKRNGKISTVNHITVSADGKTMTTKSENKVQATTTTYISIKQ